MGVVKLSTAGLTGFQKYSGMLAGNPAYSPPAFEWLETATPTNTTLTFSNLENYAGKYKHLQIRAAVQGSGASRVYMRFNGNTSSSYSAHLFYATFSGIGWDKQLSQTSIRDVIFLPGSSQPFAVAIIDILDPFSTSKNTTTRTFMGQFSDINDVVLHSGLWNNTAAITSITLFTAGGQSFSSGTRFSLYGAL